VSLGRRADAGRRCDNARCGPTQDDLLRHLKVIVNDPAGDDQVEALSGARK
jgi:hypothetical protein